MRKIYGNNFANNDAFLERRSTKGNENAVRRSEAKMINEIQRATELAAEAE